MEINLEIDKSWKDFLGHEMEKKYFKKLRIKLDREYESYEIYPEVQDLFNVFKYTAYEDVKVVILGQDPYHGEGQANGLAFSVHPGIKVPPSLRNIYKELESDLGYEIVNHGDLTSWARQGVFLLNTALTVRKGEANSHRGLGWENFTDNVISYLSSRKNPVVFILWGNNARKKKKLIDIDRHYILESAHPSPLSAYRGFFGTEPFSKTNKILREIGKEEINWQLENK